MIAHLPVHQAKLSLRFITPSIRFLTCLATSLVRSDFFKSFDNQVHAIITHADTLPRPFHSQFLGGSRSDQVTPRMVIEQAARSFSRAKDQRSSSGVQVSVRRVKGADLSGAS